MNSEQRLYSFWSSFGLPAFDETKVPDEDERLLMFGSAFPYITYETAVTDFGNEIALAASAWYRSESWEAITRKVNEIENRIGRGGIILRTDKGAIWLKKGSPFAQRMADAGDDGIRRMNLNLSAEFIE